MSEEKKALKIGKRKTWLFSNKNIVFQREKLVFIDAHE
jgi:hypothetical protein